MKNLHNNILIILLLLFGIYGNAQIHKNITAVQADSLINANINNPNFTILDVRTPSEFATGHILNALNIDYYSSTFTQQINALNKNNKYLVHCKSGSRSPKAIDTMKMLGFIESYNMIGGINAWKAAGFQIVTKTDELIAANNQFSIFPNPAGEYIELFSENDDLTLKSINIKNLNGQIVRSLQLNQTYGRIDVGDLKNGAYIIEIYTNSSVQFSKLVVCK